jgi:hypothetical protein
MPFEKGWKSTGYKHGEIQHINGRRVASPEYNTWQHMKNRCLNPYARDYKYYGGRGITIDSAWLVFENFLADMGRRPSSEYTLERINNNGNYCKDNCEWTTREDQARNRPAYNKLNMVLADQIRKEYATGKFSQDYLAVKYDITQYHISAIIHYKIWK